MNTSAKMRILFAGIVTCAVAATALISVWAGSNTAKDPNQTAQKTEVPQPKEQPMIIWFHSGFGNSPLSLKTALSSGLITHVLLLYMHRDDADWKVSGPVREAIEMVKKSDAKLIWCRDLWPYYANSNIKLTDIFDPNYYIQEIQFLRAEAKMIGADFVGFDTEPYGKTPMYAYSRGEIRLNSNDLRRLKSIIKRVVDAVGKTDFILPAGWRGNRMPYDILAELGTNRISESTYYCNYERIKRIKTPYDIFGAYVKTVRRRDKNPSSPYFLVSDVFERSQLWSDKKGVFLYTDTKEALAVAKELVAYGKSLPKKNSGWRKEPNSKKHSDF